MKPTPRLASIALVVFVALVFVMVLQLLRVSTIPWEFFNLLVGRIFGPVLGLVLSTIIFLVVLAIPAWILVSYVNLKGDLNLKELASLLTKKKTTGKVVLGIGLSFLILFSSSLLYMEQVIQSGQKINLFVAANANRSLSDYVSNISSFLNDNFKNAYGKPEVLFKIDTQIMGTLLDPYLMKNFEVTKADLIVYQEWGTCGEEANLIEELLHRAGYNETREAHFKNIDHQWAEVNYQGKWLIVDPGYIGNLKEIQNLKNFKADFRTASGVEVQYYNGTTIDASHEYGY